MIQVAPKLLEELSEIQLTPRDMIILQRLLTDEEFTQVMEETELTTEAYIKLICNMLNSRNRLPKKYKGFVVDYVGFEGTMPDEVIY